MEAGRDPNCEIPLPDFPMVSWRHARFTRTPSGILVEDLGSRNGTYVNGVRISGKVLAKAGQEIGLGSVRFQLMENGELGAARLQRQGHHRGQGHRGPRAQRQALLDAVSLTVFPYELVALMGPAGAGKTTLLKALNGYTRPAQGTVLFRGQSLYDYYDLYRHMMGYVPQDDIVHPQLTVRQALYFSARLRTDLTDAEIDHAHGKGALRPGHSRQDRHRDRLAGEEDPQRRPAQARQHCSGTDHRYAGAFSG